MFKISLLNPLRFIDTSAINNEFDGNFAIEQVLTYQNPKCYLQKWQKADSLKLQVLSDYLLSDLLIRDIYTNKIAATIPWEIQPTQIVGQTFSVYELSHSLNIDEGDYYAEFSFNDGQLVHVLNSEPFNVKVVQSNTILIKYKNSENDKDIIFNTGIEFQFRVEGAVKYDAPGNNRNVYNDQTVNPTLLSATPFRKFKLFIGFKYGVPFWVQDKVNVILTVNQVSYDNVYYQTPDEAEWETEKDDITAFIGSSILIYPTNNNFQKYENTPINEDNEFIPMQKVLKYMGISADLVIGGKFKAFTLLEHICIINRSGNWVLTVASSDEQIGTFRINDQEKPLTIEHLFSGNSNLILSGIDGKDIDLFVVYKQLDEAPVPLTPSEGTGVKEGKGSTKVYTEVEVGDLNIHFNLATGLGRANTAYDGWAFMDGRNGTKDMRKRVPIMFDREDAAWTADKLGTNIGSRIIKLSKGQLPAEGVSMFTDSVNYAGGAGNTPGLNDTVARARNKYTEHLNYEMVKGNGVVNIGKSGNMGNGDDLDITPNGIISIWIVKLTD